ncbi:MAG: glycosyltransferase family 4 protein [Chloroflexi bacterium]|nr:glycosyltransferase family 4 protein [Chloroflexota bacterium]
MRILYLYQDAIAWSAFKGPHIHIWSIINELRKQGSEVRFINPQPKRRVVEYHLVGEPVGELNRGFTHSRVFKWGESAIRRLQRLLHIPYFGFFDSIRLFESLWFERAWVEIVYERFSLMCYGGSLLARHLGIPIVLEVQADILNLEMPFHANRTSGLQKKIAGAITQQVLNQSAQIIAVSEEVRNQLTEAWNQCPDKISVVPCGVYPQIFSPGVSQFRTRMGWETNPVIGFIGAFYPWHGVEVLVKSFAHIRRFHPGAKLLLIGAGPELEPTKTLVKELDLEDDVFFTGIVPHDSMPDYLNAMDIAAAPYIEMDRELWFSPLKLFEYMAAGKAIVAANSGQISRILRNYETGLLVTPGSVSEIAQAIDVLIRDPEMRQKLGEKARREAIQHHSWESRALDTARILQEVMSRKKVKK